MKEKTMDEHWEDFLAEHIPTITDHAKKTAKKYGLQPEDLIAHGDYALTRAVARFKQDHANQHTDSPTEFNTYFQNQLSRHLDSEAKKLIGGPSQKMQNEAKIVATPIAKPPVTEIDPAGYIPQPPRR